MYIATHLHMYMFLTFIFENIQMYTFYRILYAKYIFMWLRHTWNCYIMHVVIGGSFSVLARSFLFWILLFGSCFDIWLPFDVFVPGWSSALVRLRTRNTQRWNAFWELSGLVSTMRQLHTFWLLTFDFRWSTPCYWMTFLLSNFLPKQQSPPQDFTWEHHKSIWIIRNQRA